LARVVCRELEGISAERVVLGDRRLMGSARLWFALVWQNHVTEAESPRLAGELPFLNIETVRADEVSEAFLLFSTVVPTKGGLRSLPFGGFVARAPAFVAPYLGSDGAAVSIRAAPGLAHWGRVPSGWLASGSCARLFGKVQRPETDSVYFILCKK
jgi:hypothetical protein